MIRLDRLWYDNSVNTLYANSKLVTSGTLTSQVVAISATVATTQSIPSGANTPISFTIANDVLTNWPVRTTATRFVVPLAGTYQVTAQAGYATPPGTAGINKLLVFYNTVGNVATLVGSQTFPEAVQNNVFSWSGQVTFLGNGDYLTVDLYQQSGGAVNAGGTNSDGGNYNNLSMYRIGG